MPNILIISLFGDIFNSNSRVYKIARAFSGEITFITPNFSHGEKRYKEKRKIFLSIQINIVYLSVPRYLGNLSVKRLYSHLTFALKLKSYLKKLDNKPEIIICLMPTSSAAYIAGKYCKKKKIFFVIDVIDLWPDSVIPFSKYKRLMNKLLFTWKALTNKSYSLADYISGESKAYAYAAHKVNPAVPWSFTYLGVDNLQTIQQIESSSLKLSKPDGVINLCYGGSLGKSYDFDNILKALKFIHSCGIKYKMFFIGEGEKRKYIERYAKDYNLNVEITGRLKYPDYLKYLSICDIGFNSFIKGTRVVHSYKFNDYCACGLFIFNNLNGETADMIEKYDIGLNYDDKDLAYKLFNVCRNWDLYRQNLKNFNLLIKNELDSEVIYTKLKDNILTAHNIFHS